MKNKILEAKKIVHFSFEFLILTFWLVENIWKAGAEYRKWSRKLGRQSFLPLFSNFCLYNYL